MSLATFKKKSVINYGSKRSAKGPGGVWLPQGPFGHSTTGLQLSLSNPGYSGFSLNGGNRNIGGVGREMKMSKSGTPYRGTEAIGFGGNNGRYPSAILVDNGQSTGAISNSKSSPVVQPVLNALRVNTMGTQYAYIKPSVLSTRGMLAKKYRWAYSGTYPNYWVQPNYTGNQTDNASQQMYIQNKASETVRKLDVNDIGTYEGNIIRCGPTLCKPGRSTAGVKFNDMARNGPYTKVLGQPTTYSHYNLYLTRGCKNPVGPQKPFPYAVQTGTGINRGGINVSNVGNSCGTSKNVVLTPPSWYISYKPGEQDKQKHLPQTTQFVNQTR